jgi:OHCU decarboxylase
MSPLKPTIADLNASDEKAFIAVCGPLFEHSPWIAERTWTKRPFPSREALYRALCDSMYDASPDEQVALIAAHPDLVGRLARAGRVTRESMDEQKAAGLDALTEAEIETFERSNQAYRDKFGFPFVICARENRKEAILASFPIRLANARESEIRTALGEIAKIARLRLLDAIRE